MAGARTLARIYFIGGASGAGKSTIAAKLGERHGIPVVELDAFQRILIPAFDDREALFAAMRNLASGLAIDLLGARSPCLLEGSWIEVAEAARLRTSSANRFHPVYCGFPGAQAEQRLQSIQEAKLHWLNWLAGEDEAAALSFLRKQIQASRRLQVQCRDAAIPFFDLSDQSSGQAELASEFDRWAAEPASA